MGHEKSTARTLSSTAAVLALFGAAGVVTAPAANAASTCYADHVLVADRGILPDTYKASGACSAIDANMKAQISLDVILSSDLHTQWFTRTNTVYSTASTAGTRGAYYTVRSI